MRIFVIGSMRADEFLPLELWLRRSCDSLFFSSPAEIEPAAANDSTISSAPDLIVWAQSFRGQFSEADVVHVRSLFPESHHVVLVGSWSEGETRSGSPLSGVGRIYAAEFVARLNRLLARADYDLQELNSSHGFDHELDLPNESTSARTIVISRDLDYADSIASAIGSAGGTAIALRPETPFRSADVQVIVYDVHPHADERRRHLNDLARWNLPIVGLVDFPRGHEITELHSWGIAVVLPKPCLIDDLLFQIDQICRTADNSNDRTVSDSAA